MAVRESNALFLEILTASPSSGVPIEFDVYDGTNVATMLATLENAYERSFTTALADLGAGGFRLNRHDPKATAAILHQGNLVKCKVGGVYRFAWWIDDLVDIPLAPGEGAAESINVTGRGALAYLERAIVYPPVYPPATVGYIGSTEVNNGGASSIAMAKPTGAKVGDTLLYGIAVQGGSSVNVTPPAGRGWVALPKTDAGTALALALFRRKITSSTIFATDTFTFGGANDANGIALAFRGVNADLASGSEAAQNNGSTVNITAPTLTPSLVNSVSVGFFATNAGTSVTAPAGYFERRDISGGGCTIQASTKALAGLDPTGPIIGVAGAADVNVGAHVLLAPSSASAAEYSGQTWGAILVDQITEAQARGALPDLTYDFTADLDSHGAAWADTPVIAFPAGTTLLDVVRQAIAMGLDVQMTPELRLQMFGEYARHKETTVVLRAGYHLTDTVEKRIAEHGLKSRLLVEGAGGLYFEIADPAIEADPHVGRREGFLSFPGSADPTTMQRAGEATLASLAAEAEALSIPVTHGLTGGHFEPYADYRLGDWITLDVPGTYDLEAFRVAGLTLQDGAGTDFLVSIDLNSVSLEYLARLKRMLDNLGGSASAGAGSAAGALSGTVGGGGSGGASGKVAVNIGDTPGYLYDKIGVAGLTKAIVGTQVVLTAAGTLDGLTDVDTTTVPPTAGQGLVWDAVAGIWEPGTVATQGATAAFVGARAYRGVDQTGVVTATDTRVLYTGADWFDTDGFHDPAVNPSRMTIPAGQGGKYLAIATVPWDTNTTGNRHAGFYVNGVGYHSFDRRAASNIGVQTISGVLNLNPGDYVEVNCYQDSGANRTLNFGLAGGWFDLVKLDGGRLGNGIGAKAYASAATNVTNVTFTPVALAAEAFDTDGFHSNVTNNSRMTIPTGLGGKYLVIAQADWDSNTSGERIIEIALGGAYGSGFYGWSRDNIPNGNGITRSVAHILDLVPGNYVEMAVYQNSGSTRTVAPAGSNRSSLELIRIDSTATDPMAVSAFAVNNTAAALAASAAVITTTVTLARGRYRVTASLRTSAMTTAGSPGSVYLRVGGVQLPNGTQIDLRPSPSIQWTLFGWFDHTGGSVTVDAYFSRETGTTTFGLVGTAEERFGQKMMIERIGNV